MRFWSSEGVEATTVDGGGSVALKRLNWPPAALFCGKTYWPRWRLKEDRLTGV